MIIYKTINKINGKFYIGKDAKNDPNYLGSGKILKRAIKKYGKENFVKEIIEKCKTTKQLNKREIFWIDKFNATNLEIGYNLTKFGGGGYNEFAVKANKKKKGKTWKEIYTPSGLEIMKNLDRSGENNSFYRKTHTEENKKIFADNAKKLHTGKKRSEETKRRITEGIKNSDHAEIMSSPEMSKKISEATKKGMDNPEVREKCAYWKGKKQPEEMVKKRSKKVSEALKGKPKSEAHKKALKEAWKRRKMNKKECK